MLGERRLPGKVLAWGGGVLPVCAGQEQRLQQRKNVHFREARPLTRSAQAGLILHHSTISYGQMFFRAASLCITPHSFEKQTCIFKSMIWPLICRFLKLRYLSLLTHRACSASQVYQWQMLRAPLSYDYKQKEYGSKVKGGFFITAVIYPRFHPGL